LQCCPPNAACCQGNCCAPGESCCHGKCCPPGQNCQRCQVDVVDHRPIFEFVCCPRGEDCCV
jgi:hypothetical protein